MKTIWKFPIDTTEIQTISIPRDAYILTVQCQHGGKPTLWVLLNPEDAKESRPILVYRTGHIVEGVDRYIGTYQMDYGNLVFHVFEGIG